jgi:hypothetical protein
MAAPAAAAPAARQPSTPTDPSNNGATPGAQPLASLAQVQSMFKKIQDELDGMPGLAEFDELKEVVLGMANTQRILFALLLEVAEPMLGAQKAVIVQMVTRALEDGGPEKLLEQTLGQPQGKA